ncbi:MAG TPA: hypothetical protein VFP61_00475 [Acidimicrobiales bacterium]|nr:hypothetical protein [Acidimicrobiales bacterium]
MSFDDVGLVANAGLVLVATLADRLGLEVLVDEMVRLGDRPGGFRPGRKLLTLVHAMVAGASHIDHVDMLRAGATGRVLGHRVMAPSTIGTWLRSFSFGHVRQLEAAIGVLVARAWHLGAGPGEGRLDPLTPCKETPHTPGPSRWADDAARRRPPTQRCSEAHELSRTIESGTVDWDDVLARPEASLVSSRRLLDNVSRGSGRQGRAWCTAASSADWL